MAGRAERAAGTVPPLRGHDPREPVDVLLRELRTGPDGLSTQEARRRLDGYGRNELRRQRRGTWLGDLGRQLVHPLALLLWIAAGLAWVAGTSALAGAIAAVIALNAVFAFAQERQAERAVEALTRYLPQRVAVLRDGQRTDITAAELVPGDVLLIAEGDRISADARLLSGSLEVDLSALTGESQPAFRAAEAPDREGAPLQARNLVFSGTSCLGGEARALVYATGMGTELGRIAALSQRAGRAESPLERQVRRVAWLIAVVAAGAGLVFFPVGVLAAGMSISEAFAFAIGLLVANVPEGLLPTITLALAVGVRGLARLGAVVKRLSAVETLGSTDVICTDKTGTITENKMRVAVVWVADRLLDATKPLAMPEAGTAVRELGRAAALCNNAEIRPDRADTGDPTETALLRFAAGLGIDVAAQARRAGRRSLFHFDPRLRLMSTVDADDRGLWINTKGAPEEVLSRSTRIVTGDGREHPLDEPERGALAEAVTAQAARGMRMLGVARRQVPAVPGDRAEAERDLAFLGFVGILDPPRPEVAGAVARCHTAGIRIIMVTGDHGLTATAIARQVGITRGEPTVLNGEQVDAMPDDELRRVLTDTPDLIFARTSPETKLRIAESLRATGHVVAMTGDGVNDAPALRRADIGVAMGRAPART